MRFSLLLLWIAALWAAEPAFDYPAMPNKVHEVGGETRDGVVVRDVTFANIASETAAYLVPGKGRGPHPAVLFVHWLEPEATDSNRTQFLPEATALAQQGVTSLLVETMWSDPQWFNKRDRAQDFAKTVQQTKELRRALDVLLAQPGIDRNRVAYVGHDFGAMFGALVAGVDHRVKILALQAGTPRFSDWYLLGTKPSPEEKQRIIDELAPLDPVAFIAKAKAPVLFQFGRTDPYVPEARANAFFAAAPEPKELKWYAAGHALNAEARAGRLAWLRAKLRLQ